MYIFIYIEREREIIFINKMKNIFNNINYNIYIIYLVEYFYEILNINHYYLFNKLFYIKNKKKL